MPLEDFKEKSLEYIYKYKIQHKIQISTQNGVRQ